MINSTILSKGSNKHDGHGTNPRTSCVPWFFHISRFTFHTFWLLLGMLLFVPTRVLAEDVNCPPRPQQTVAGVANSLAPEGSDSGKSNSLSNNTVTAKSSCTVGGSIFGAVNLQDSRVVEKNKVSICSCATVGDGTIVGSGNVYGGYASNSSGNATARDNSVTIEGSSVKTSVYGAYAYSDGGKAIATGNHVIIDGGIISGSVFGAVAALNSGGEATATGNTITIQATPSFGQNSNLFGGYSEIGASPAACNNCFINNTLNLHDRIKIYNLANFQKLNFYLPTRLQPNQALITLAINNGVANLTDGNTLTDKGNNSSLVDINVPVNSPVRQIGEEITLIDASPSTTTDQKLITNNLKTGSGRHGVLLGYEFELTVKDDKLLATLKSIQATPEGKAFSESRLAASALLNQGGDLLALRGVSEAALAVQETDNQTFGLVESAQQRHNTGSHIKSNDVSILAGVAIGHEVTAGRLTAGAFVEYGRASYDTYNSIASHSNVKGSGDASYTGGGLLGRIDFKANDPDSHYLEASIRAGTAHNKYEGIENLHVRYDDISSNYYGIHLGAGKLFQRWDEERLDIYVKFLWTQQEGETVTLSNDETIDFDTVQSSRSRIGGRYTWILGGMTRLYIGASWEHEFDGKGKASRSGYAIDAPSLRGDSGIAEAGILIEPKDNRPFSLNLGVQGYSGTRQGTALNLRLGYRF